MNSENSKLIKTEEGSINEELEEYVDTLSSKKPFNLESEQIKKKACPLKVIEICFYIQTLY